VKNTQPIGVNLRIYPLVGVNQRSMPDGECQQAFIPAEYQKHIQR